ncbi:MAG: hypothetical protein IJB98_03035 [Clostridia bacterium]|nr:hypothetical protein [Clostridia bacterium]
MDGREIIDIQALEFAYKRMEMLHMHIQPEINVKKATCKKRKKVDTSREVVETLQKKEKSVDVSVDTHITNKSCAEDWSFIELAKLSKQMKRDMVELLVGKVSVTEVMI